VKLRVGPTRTYIEGAFPAKTIDSVTSYKVHGRWFAKSYKKGHWDGIKRFRSFDNSRRCYYFPTGFLEDVCRELDLIEFPYELYDEREVEIPDTWVTKLGDKELRQYQAEALEAALTNCRGVIKLPTGGGKTVLGAAILASYDRPAIWLTHRKALLHQTADVLSELLGRDVVGRVGDGIWEPAKVTVAMVQTLHAHQRAKRTQKVLGPCEVVIGDEIHHLESKQWHGIFDQIPALYRFGLTATPSFQGPGLGLIGMTGPLIFNMTTRDLIELGKLVPPRIWIVKVPKDSAKFESDAYSHVYSRGVVQNEFRNSKILQAACLFAEEDKPTLILVNRIKHGEALKKQLDKGGVKTAFINGKLSQNARDEHLGNLWSGDLDAVIAMREIMGEGVDLPGIRAIINATGTKGGGSKKSGVAHEVGRVTVQILGRGLRPAPEKDYVDYVDFSDTTHRILASASLERLNTLEQEGYREGYEILPWRKYPL